MKGCSAQYHRTFGYTESVETRFIKPPKVALRNYREVADLVYSIKTNGLLQPIIIRPIGDRFEVVAGARRLEACRRLRWSTVPCIIRKLSDKESYEASLIENIQRKTMNPLEEASAFEKYVQQEGWGGETALARQIGKSQEYISHRISLLRLPEATKREIMRHRLNASVAQEIARLPEKEVQMALTKIATEQHLTVVAVRKAMELFGTDLYPGALESKAEPRMAGIAPVHPPETYHTERMDPDFIPAHLGDDHRNLTESEQLENATLILNLALIRMSNLLDGLPHESGVKEILTEERSRIHDMIDLLVKLKAKMRKLPVAQFSRS
jgi:ParB/RepB/Spo0J family partition protein